MGEVFECRDPYLRRRVAVKVLHSGRSDDEGRLRVLREGQALARLEHPNVVRVYEIGEARGQLYLAMEFVEGSTLRQWLSSTPAWRKVVEVFMQAARGLAAAHKAGLVHRDFKPENVLVCSDTDGVHARVLDFGLARATEAADPGEDPDAAVTLTQSGAAHGTVAYMAPEQLRGEVVAAAADQFAWCVALWEALYGARPFAGQTRAALLDAIESQQLGEAKATGVPRAYAGILTRGLSHSPAERWPDVQALVGALGKASPLRKRRWGIAAAVVTIAGTVFGISANASDCTDGAERFAEAWPGNGDAEARLTAVLDEYGVRWARAHDESCRNSAGSDHASTEQRACLAAALARVDEISSFASAPDPSQSHRAVSAAVRLRAPEDCALAAQRTPLPADPAIRAQAAALVERLARVEAMLALDQLERGPEARAALDEARTLGYEPTTARALWVTAGFARAAGRYERAEVELREAARLASATRRDRLLAEIGSSLTVVLSDQSRFAAAVEAGEANLVLLERLPDAPVIRSRALRALGNAKGWELDYPNAIDLFERSIAHAEGNGDAARAETVESISALVETRLELDRSDATATALARRALEEAESLYGWDHPRTHGARFGLGMALSGSGSVDEGVALMREAVEADTAHRGTHTNHVYYHYEIGNSFRFAGRCAEALDPFQRALEIAEQHLGPDDYQAAMVRRDMAACHRSLGSYDVARRGLERALIAVEASRGRHHPATGLVHAELVALELDEGDYAKASARATDVLSWLPSQPDSLLRGRLEEMLGQATAQ